MARTTSVPQQSAMKLSTVRSGPVDLAVIGMRRPPGHAVAGG
jgi:hypothetical protein